MNFFLKNFRIIFNENERSLIIWHIIYRTFSQNARPRERSRFLRPSSLPAQHFHVAVRQRELLQRHPLKVVVAVKTPEEPLPGGAGVLRNANDISEGADNELWPLSRSFWYYNSLHPCATLWQRILYCREISWTRDKVQFSARNLCDVVIVLESINRFCY